MKRSSQWIKITFLICLITQMFYSINVSALAGLINDEESASDEAIEYNTSETSVNAVELLNNTEDVSSSNISFSIISPNITLPHSTCISFDNTGVVEYSVTSTGLSVTERQDAPMTYDITATAEFGTFEIVAEKADGNILTKKLYTYRSDESIFVSEISSDVAWHQSNMVKNLAEEITESFWHQDYSEYSRQFSIEETDVSFTNTAEANQAVSEGKIVVRGRMTWTNESGSTMSLSFTKIELRNQYAFSSAAVSTTYTDKDGYYYFAFSPNDLNILPNQELNLYVRVYAESTTLKTMVPFLECFNYYDSNIVEASTENPRIINISRRLKQDNGISLYRLIYIQQGMVVGQRFALEMGMQPTDMLKVFCLGDLETLSDLINVILPFEDIYLNDIALCYDSISLIGYSNHNRFYTAIHEYGHFVQHTVDTYGPEVKNHLYDAIPENGNDLFVDFMDCLTSVFSVIDDYSHYIYENHFGDENTTKAFQMELTWSEAWASAFAEIAFSYYYFGDSFETYKSILYNNTVNYETIVEVDKFYDGEAQEYAVTSFLWDLYDNSVSEANDNISMTEQKWWDLTTAAGTYTLQDFSENIINNYPELIGEVGEIMSKHNIAPKITYDSYNHATNASPRLKWNKNGGASYPNDIFRVAIYDNENNLMGITDEINNYTNALTFIIPTDLWNSVMAQEKEGIVIYAVVYGYRSGSFTSGPYFSKPVELYNNYEYHKDHTRNKSSDGEEYHTITCECGYTTQEKHDFIYSYYSATRHKRSCECGYERLSAHVVASGSGMIKRCVDCGALVNLGDTPGQLQSVGIAYYITDSGSYVRPDGIIVLSAQDYELYLAGELDLDSLLSRGGVTQ